MDITQRFVNFYLYVLKLLSKSSKVMLTTILILYFLCISFYLLNVYQDTLMALLYL